MLYIFTVFIYLDDDKPALFDDVQALILNTISMKLKYLLYT